MNHLSLFLFVLCARIGSLYIHFCVCVCPPRDLSDFCHCRVRGLLCPPSVKTYIVFMIFSFVFLTQKKKVSMHWLFLKNNKVYVHGCAYMYILKLADLLVQTHTHFAPCGQIFSFLHAKSFTSCDQIFFFNYYLVQFLL